MVLGAPALEERRQGNATPEDLDRPRRKWTVTRVRPTPTGAIRGPLLSYSGDPFRHGIRDTRLYEPEALFVQMTLADDRAVRATYAGGRKVYQRA